MPITAFAEIDLGMQSQMLDSQIEKLTSERDSKYEALQKCEKSTKGFKIAGITTLVATGFGIYGNIKLSEKIKGKSGFSGGGTLYDGRSNEQKVSGLCADACIDPETLMCKGLKAKGKCDNLA